VIILKFKDTKLQLQKFHGVEWDGLYAGQDCEAIVAYLKILCQDAFGNTE
jgi:hypothetical protein